MTPGERPGHVALWDVDSGSAAPAIPGGASIAYVVLRSGGRPLGRLVLEPPYPEDPAFWSEVARGIPPPADPGGRASEREISVVVATRDRPDDLDRCLAALGALDPAPGQIVVADSASGDRAAVAAIAAGRGARLVRLERPGLSITRNAGAAVAEGKFVAFLDEVNNPSSKTKQNIEGMMTTQTLSKQTQKNWWIDISLFLGAVLSALSGIYFLYFPTGGYQGGRNPYYGIIILFGRETWGDIHTWGGIAMIAAAVIHLIIHWSWVVNMTRRFWKEVFHPMAKLNSRSKWDYLLNSIVAVSFLFTALSGVYFLFVPCGNWSPDPQFLFTRTNWWMSCRCAPT